ncbi:MAG: porin family protein [Gammaproteobacteria bacterium]|nr:porin family protein [Gammaproteobacteria bacterium]
MNKSLVPALLMVPLLAGPAFAADNGVYVGAALGQSETRLRESSINLKDQSAGFKVLAGVRPIDLLAVELNYIDFGSASAAGARADTKAGAGFLVGYLPLPIPLLDVYGKAGAAAWKFDASDPLVSLSQSGSSFAWGAGAGLHFGSLGVRLEYERFNSSASRNLELLSLGVTFMFL